MKRKALQQTSTNLLQSAATVSCHFTDRQTEARRAAIYRASPPPSRRGPRLGQHSPPRQGLGHCCPSKSLGGGTCDKCRLGNWPRGASGPTGSAPLELPLPVAHATRPRRGRGEAAIVRGWSEAVARAVGLLLLRLPPARRIGRTGGERRRLHLRLARL